MIDFLKSLFDHLEGIAGTVAVILALHSLKKNNEDKELEIYMNLYQQWDSLWVSLTAYPGRNKDLFRKNFEEISKASQENLRFSIFQIINLLSRVHHYYTFTKQDILKSDWHKEAQFMMSKKLFITAYRKFKPRYNSTFQKYIESIIVENNLPTTENDSDSYVP